MDEVLSILHALQRLVSYKRESEELKKKPKQRIAARMVTYFEEGAGKLCGFFCHVLLTHFLLHNFGAKSPLKEVRVEAIQRGFDNAQQKQ